MASQPEPIFPGQSDPKYLDLIRKITEKTLANKIQWKMTETGVSANVSGKIELGFVRDRGGVFGFGAKGWALFTIRFQSGKMIFRVENSPLTMIRPDEWPLRNAVEELYAAVEKLGRAEVEKVIELIDRI